MNKTTYALGDRVRVIATGQRGFVEGIRSSTLLEVVVRLDDDRGSVYYFGGAELETIVSVAQAEDARRRLTERGWLVGPRSTQNDPVPVADVAEDVLAGIARARAAENAADTLVSLVHAISVEEVTGADLYAAVATAHTAALAWIDTRKTTTTH